MSILIKGLKMPKGCERCWLMDGEDSWCTAMRGRYLTPDFRYGIKDKPEWCPLVEVPPHGRLIDADAIKEKIDHQRPRRLYEDAWTLTIIDDAPTVIPADKED